MSKKPPGLPQLILEAVTRSAAVKATHVNGAILWDIDALNLLQRALVDRFNETARDKKVRTRFIRELRRGMNKGEDLETKIAPRLILFAALMATGIDFDVRDKPPNKQQTLL